MPGPPLPRPGRRPRYRGTHPRHFDERYKELDPERYPEEQAKVAARGDTPAGTHRPVLLAEVLAALRPAPGEVVLDCTVGRGGHARAFAAAVGPTGVVLGLDRDREELDRTASLFAKEGIDVRVHATNFAGAGRALAAEGLDGVDVLLADLGVSSMQIDRPERGFSFKSEGPLDMRMDRSKGKTAAEWISTVPEEELCRVLGTHGEELAAAAVARAIRARVLSGPPILTTRDLSGVVLRALGIDPGGFRQRDAFSRHPAARTFQAIRIAVNREDEALAKLLLDLPWLLRSGGRAGIVCFHGGEEERVAAALAAGREAGLYASVSEPPVRPSPEECRSNPRARSARLLVAVRA
jgi:16S rRNA (cytosine1402-N4)-methyltransferase